MSDSQDKAADGSERRRFPFPPTPAAGWVAPEPSDKEIDAKRAKRIDTILWYRGLLSRRDWDKLNDAQRRAHAADDFVARDNMYALLELESDEALQRLEGEAKQDQVADGRQVLAAMERAEAERLSSAEHWSFIEAVAALEGVGPRPNILSWSEPRGRLPNARQVVRAARELRNAIRAGLLHHPLERVEVVRWARRNDYEIAPYIAGNVPDQPLTFEQLQIRVHLLEADRAAKDQTIQAQGRTLASSQQINVDTLRKIVAILARSDHGKSLNSPGRIVINPLVNSLQNRGVRISNHALKRYIMEGQALLEAGGARSVATPHRHLIERRRRRMRTVFSK